MSNLPARATWWRLALCLAAGGALLAAGCGTVANPASCADGFCHDPAFPFCDVDGTVGGGSRLTCIAVDCAPHEFAACRGDEAIVCNATGDDYDVTHCAGGCSTEAGGCKPTHIIPKYLPTVCDQPAAEPALTISESMTLDTGDDASCNGGVVDQVHGPDICVLRYGQITVERNKTLAVTGRRALALVADQALTIDGILDVSANGSFDGPGGGIIKSANTGAGAPSGGGGAGLKTRGGAGGSSTADGGALNGGTPEGDPAQLVEIVGGTQSFAWSAGGAGGAATAISCRGTVSLLGLLDAGGGGSGGNVALQGMMVVVTGAVFANGGGGGAGTAGSEGQPGADGTRSSAESAPGGARQSNEGAGGAGGREGADPKPGRKPLNGYASAGAGGGSTGFFQTYTPAGVMPMLTPAAASPPFQPNRTVETR
ncbi:MAG TPA: hypothetical protein VK932_22900 [Kofleriaceae bacterium]|nr:hypothetical protein [Kofleriaceae bacterium]